MGVSDRLVDYGEEIRGGEVRFRWECSTSPRWRSGQIRVIGSMTGREGKDLLLPECR